MSDAGWLQPAPWAEDGDGETPPAPEDATETNEPATAPEAPDAADAADEAPSAPVIPFAPTQSSDAPAPNAPAPPSEPAQPAPAGSFDSLFDPVPAGAAPAAPQPDPWSSPQTGAWTDPDPTPVAQPAPVPIAAAPVPAHQQSGHTPVSGAAPPLPHHAPPQHSARTFEAVDRLLGLFAGEVGEQRLQELKKFRLSTDPELDRKQFLEFARLVRPELPNLGLKVSAAELNQVIELAYNEFLGLGPLYTLWWQEDITEIIVDGPSDVYVEQDGRLHETHVAFRDVSHLQRVSRNLAAIVSDRGLSPTNALVTAQLPGARVNFAYEPLVPPDVGCYVTLRKFRTALGMDSLLQFGALTEEMADFLKDAVGARATIVVSGGTGAGKTTLLNALSAFIGGERVITVEDAYELEMNNRFVAQLQSKEAASADDGQLGYDLSSLIVNALRMRPDRIIVGEMREGSAATAFMQAANTGHDGCMVTVHANSPAEALRRMSGLVRKGEPGTPVDVAREDVASAVDIIVQATRRAGKRFISSIALLDTDIQGRPRLTELFRGKIQNGEPAFEKVGALRADSSMTHRMLDAGIDPTPWSTFASREELERDAAQAAAEALET